MHYRNSAIVLVFNRQGELALQLRAADDDRCPSHWDFSAGGGIDEGEDHFTAAQRELREELGVACDLEYVRMLIYEGEDFIDHIHMYKTTYEGRFKPNPHEVADIVFFSRQKIQQMIDAGEPFHPVLLSFWDKRLIPLP